MAREILSFCRESNPGRPARSAVTVLTELPRLMIIVGIFDVGTFEVGRLWCLITGPTVINQL